MKAITYSALLALGSALCVDGAAAQAPDFFLGFKECSTTLGWTSQLDYPLKTLPGDPARLACVRKNRKVTCKIAFQEGKDSAGRDEYNYDVAVETGKLLVLELPPSGADYISIDRTTNAAVIVTRILGDDFAGAKVCRGVFLTADEASALTKQAK